MASREDRQKARRILSALVFVGDLNVSPPNYKATWYAAEKFLGGILDFPSGMPFSWDAPKEATLRIEILADAATIKEVLEAVSGTDRQNERRFGKLRDDWRLPLWAGYAFEKGFRAGKPWETIERAARDRQELYGR